MTQYLIRRDGYNSIPEPNPGLSSLFMLDVKIIHNSAQLKVIPRQVSLCLGRVTSLHKQQIISMPKPAKEHSLVVIIALKN